MGQAKNLSLGERFRAWYRGLPDKKRYFEFVSALLTIPVLATIIILNWSNLRPKQETKVQPSPQIITVVPFERESTPIPTATSASCKKEVGPIEIVSPKEGEVVTEQPVCFVIEYKDSTYCSVVWRYRIDNGPWSEFTDKSVCLYNLSPGDHKFELHVKSIVSDDEVNLVRNFIYQGPNPTPVPTGQ